MKVSEFLNNTPIQVFKNVKDYHAPSTLTTLNEIIYRTKNCKDGNDSLYKHIRTLSKKERDRYKESTLPCYSPTFIYKGYRAKNKIIGINNIIYLDIDKPGFDPDQHLDKSKIITYYNTVSGKGYGILVATDNTLTVDNFNDFYYSVIDQLDLRNYYDDKVRRYHIAMTVSYDPHLFLNETELYKFTYTKKPIIVYKEKKKYNYEPINKTTKNYDSDTIRFNNHADLEGYKDGIITSDKKDIQVVKVIHYQKKKAEGSRNTILSVYANNLLWLNPNIQELHFRNQIHKCNFIFFIEPLPTNQVNKMIEHKLLSLKNKELQPVITYRKMVIHPDSKLTRQEKNKLIRNMIAEDRKEQSKQKLYKIIESWDFQKLGKISGRKIAENHPISYKTVKKYYPDFKQYIFSLNESNK